MTRFAARVAGVARISLAAAAMFLPSGAGMASEVRELPVPAATIYPNDLITNALITERRFHVTVKSVVGYATDRGDLVGKQARRRLVAGKPIPLSAITIPLAVKRGAMVAATYNEDGFAISGSLIALQDGAEGDVIDARNSSTGVVVRATVRGDGTLAVAQ